MTDSVHNRIWDDLSNDLVNLIGPKKCLLENNEIREYIRSNRTAENSLAADHFLEMDDKILNSVKGVVETKYDLQNSEIKPASRA